MAIEDRNVRLRMEFIYRGIEIFWNDFFGVFSIISRSSIL